LYNVERFAEVLPKAVKENTQSSVWPVYEHYEVVEEEGETFVVASRSPASFAEAEPKEEGVAQVGGSMEGRRWQGSERRDPLQYVPTLYSPLERSELVVELAKLAEKEITPEEVLRWTQAYGLLGIRDNTVSTHDRFGHLRDKGRGQRESVRQFAEAAGEIRACLRTYELLTREEELDLDKLASEAGPLPLEALRQMDCREGEERLGLFRFLRSLVQTRLKEHCYPRFTTHTRGGLADSRFSLSPWGFKTLLGAIWLHMASLLEAESERVRRCKLPGCLRVIHFEPGEPPPDPGGKKNPRGRYKTRDDREFCKGRGCKQKYHYRKKAGWPGYD